MKLVNSMNRYFLFAGLNLNLNITKKEPEKCMFHGRGFEYSNVEAWLLFAPSLSKFLATRLPVGFIRLSFYPWLKTIITPLVCRLHKFSVSNACVFFRCVITKCGSRENKLFVRLVFVKKFLQTSQFHEFFKNNSTRTHARITKYGSREK